MNQPHTHVPRIREREESLVRQLRDLASPLLLRLVCGVQVMDVLFATLGDCVDDPITLYFHAAGTIGEGRRSLSAVQEEEVWEVVA